MKTIEEYLSTLTWVQHLQFDYQTTKKFCLIQNVVYIWLSSFLMYQPHTSLDHRIHLSINA